LTFSEQKLILKIKKEIKDNKDIKYLYIIHNLKNYTKISQVEKYIENTLCKSSTFSVKKSESITSSTKKMKDGYHFNEEKNAEYKQLNIFHLIFAQDGSEAGNFFNEYAIDFIETQYNVQWDKKNFDVIEEVKKQFSRLSKLYLEQKIEKNEFNSNEDILQNKIIKLNKEKELTLKKCLLDEIGNPIFKMNGLEPKYNVFVNDQFLEVRVELPGNCVPEVSLPKYLGEDTIITISGNKNYDKEPKNPEECIYNLREYGKFEIDIPFKTEDYKINPNPIEVKIIKGVLILKYELVNDKNKKEVIIEDE
jgi:HSP20 family molecular chaperone IbpA